MDTTLEYYDIAGQNIYCMIFSSGNLGLTNTTGQFAVYTDAAATGFAHTMTADGNRTNRYTFNLNTYISALTEGVYEIAVFSRTGSTPNISNDNIKMVDQMYWSSGLVDEVVTPNLTTTDFVGNIPFGNTFAWLAEVENQFGSYSTVDNNLDYIIKENATTTIATGSMTLLEPGIYYATRTVTPSVFENTKSYQIIMDAHINNIPVKAATCFTVSSGQICPTGYPDILNLLGYVTGSITTSVTTSGFNTNLTNTTNDLFNGGILRITSGTNKGHARIISDYVGLTKRVSLNKPMKFLPSSGTTFVIYPIGGELNN